MRAVRYGIGVLGALLTTAIIWSALPAQAQPQFQVDPFWPKPLPRDPVSHKPWVTGEVGGTCIDSQDHLFTVNRASQGTGLVAPEDVIAVASPPIIEYDSDGNAVHWFGDADIVPSGLHGC